ncbi:hypothetical protein HS125_05900 [bacterium]|nr:hypothetical protein [bacterium]
MRELFVSRADVFAVQVRRGTGWGYQPVRRSLTDEDLLDHLEGEITLGVYPALSETRWLCIDIDSRDPAVVGAVGSAFEARRIPFYLEDSGNKGRHVWVFWERPLANRKAREIGRSLGAEHEIFPKQDRVVEGRLGSLLKLPLGIHRTTGRRCVFVDSELRPYAGQLAFLKTIKRVDGERLWKRLGCDIGRKRTRTQPLTTEPLVEPAVMRPCVRRLLCRGVERGMRNRTGHAIASELHRVGVDKETGVGIMAGWNARNRPPLPSGELAAVLDSAYAELYRYGCGAGSLLRSVSNCSGPEDCEFFQRPGDPEGKRLPVVGSDDQEQAKKSRDGDQVDGKQP